MTFQDYRGTTDRIVDAFGKRRIIGDLEVSDFLLRWRREGKVPGVSMNPKVVRFSLRQVAQALNIELAETAK